jgi:autotransporter-associated beta strand protein
MTLPASLSRAGASCALLASLLVTALSAQTTGFNQSGVGLFDYNDPANWTGGIINGVWDVTLDLPASQTVTFGNDTSLSTGLSFQYTNSGNLTLRGTGGNFTLTLGGDILHNTASGRTVNLGSNSANQALNIDLGGTVRTFTVGNGRTLGLVNVISNGGVVTNGGTVNFSGVNTYAGTTTVTSGVLALNGSVGSAANSAITVQGGGASTSTLQFNSTSSGSTGTTRAQSVTLRGAGTSSGAFLTVTGNSGANSVDTITGTLTASAGLNTVGVSANGARAAQLVAGSLVREAGSTLLFRGSNLGVAAIADHTAGHANIVFSSTPSLTGGGGSAGQSTIGIIVGAYGDTTSGGDGKTGGLVTYDATQGVRLLAGSEYAATVADGQTQLDNVRIARSSGGASQDVNLTAATTTINSLSFNITGAGTNSGVTLGGDTGTTLKINSGVIFASQQVTSVNATDKILISAPTLDLNGKEGVILAFTNGVSNGNTSAPLEISSVITNDGGNGVTFGGTGQTILTGSSANTYTGVTTLNSGVLRLNKSVANTGITTDLVINGGTLLKTSNAIADTASVTINGGSFVMDSTTSSGNNGHQETVNNFTLNGGGFSNHGTGAVLTVNGNLTLNGSQLGMNQGGDVNVLGNTVLAGGVLIARESTSTTVFNGLTNLDTVAITNTASGAYTAITLTGHASNKGAQLTLKGDLTFTGNGTNTNTVLIASSDAGLANQGVFLLDGSRTFTIGDGAADDDLTVAVSLADGTSTGGLVKAGTGTLALSGDNTYTGPTVITAGTLRLGAANRLADTGGLVLAGGTFSTGGFSETLGTLTLSANSVIDLGAGDSDLVFAASNGVTWASSVTLSFIHFDAGTDSIRIGTGDSGLSAGQLGQITINGFATGIDADGFLFISAVPEPSAFALLAGLGGLAFAGLRRRR